MSTTNQEGLDSQGRTRNRSVNLNTTVSTTEYRQEVQQLGDRLNDMLAVIGELEWDCEKELARHMPAPTYAVAMYKLGQCHQLMGEVHGELINESVEGVVQ